MSVVLIGFDEGMIDVPDLKYNRLILELLPQFGLADKLLLPNECDAVLVNIASREARRIVETGNLKECELVFAWSSENLDNLQLESELRTYQDIYIEQKLSPLTVVRISKWVRLLRKSKEAEIPRSKKKNDLMKYDGVFVLDGVSSSLTLLKGREKNIPLSDRERIFIQYLAWEKCNPGEQIAPSLKLEYEQLERKDAISYRIKSKTNGAVKFKFNSKIGYSLEV